ncbi:hypothetical protein [Streptomyces sp. NPDC060366]|uniref:hypothetical protein n=1 Tax=Streptomyces sp. NPDC060366 TaxID=3347105 RepID=UPI0036626682
MSEQPGMDWKPRHISVTGDGLAARVVLDDQDISRHVQGVTIEHRVGQAPVVVLYAHPTAGATFDGLARVAVAEQADPGEAMAAFLASIDPDALAKAALQRDLDGSPNELTKAMLEQLVDWAQGRA